MDTLDFVKVIGQGSYGTVWKCRCKATGRLFAVKEFKSSNDEQNIDIELRPLLTLRHDNLVKVFCWFSERQTLHGVFELLDHDVKQELQKTYRGLGSAVLKKYTYQILRAVAFLHSVNIVHRDIKPANVLVSKAGVIKLADLGLSEKADSAVNPLLMVGTLSSMAPEILLGLCDNYKRSDVWAVGCTILAMARGKSVFGRRQLGEVIPKIMHTVGPLSPPQLSHFRILYPSKELRKPPKLTVPLTEKYKVCDQRLAEVIEGCLQMEPCNRTSCEQLLNFEYFTDGQFDERFLIELNGMVRKDHDGARGQPWVTKFLPRFLTPHLPLDVSSPECIANRMAEPAVQIDSASIDEIENLEGIQDGEKEESAGLEPQCLPACSLSLQSASDHAISNTPQVSSPEQIANRVVAVNPAVLNDPEAINEIEILEEEQDGEREERAVSEERPAEEEAKRKRGFRAAIRRILSSIRRRFTVCCTPGSGGDRRRGAGRDVRSGSQMRVHWE